MSDYGPIKSHAAHKYGSPYAKDEEIAAYARGAAYGRGAACARGTSGASGASEHVRAYSNGCMRRLE